MFQKFDFVVKDRKGCENVMAGHLSKIESGSSQQITPIVEEFLDKCPSKIEGKLSWFVDYMNYLASGVLPPQLNSIGKIFSFG